MAFGLAALLAVTASGLAFWGMPVTRAMGQPGAFTEAPVTATDLARQRVSNSPALVADPSASQFVVAAHRVDGPEPGCGLQVSGDGGKSWVGAIPVPVLPPGAQFCHAPEVAFDGRGILHYLFVGLSDASHRPMGVFLTTSSDRARTFSPPRQVLGPLSYGVRMAVDPISGRVHLAWLRAGEEPTATGFASLSNSVVTSSSSNGGVSFSEPVVVSTPGARRPAAPALALGPKGQVEVAYYDLGDDARDYEGQPGPAWEGPWSLLAARSSNGGGSFAPGVVVDDAIVAPFRVPSIFTMPPPALVAGAKRSCLAWTDARHGDADVLLRCSSAGGRWSPVRRVNDDPQGNGVSQYLPQLAQAPTGRLDVAFYDRRISPERNDRVTVGFAYSYDGRKFSSNIALTRSPSDPGVGPAAGAGGEVDFGSRLGLLSQNSSALAAWTDTRNGRQGVIAQDVYSAEATLLFASVRPRWAVPAGVALAGASVGVMLLLQRLDRRRRAE